MHTQSNDVLSFFSGAGGFSYGFALAGLAPVSGAEIDTDACATYEENLGSPCLNVDLSIAPTSLFIEAAKHREPFAIIGGPPCQGFSTAGARNFSDPRNQLIFHYLQIVADVRPRWFIFENVEGLLTSGDGTAVASLVSEFIRIGYSVRVEKVNLAAFGVPQTRKRVLIIGNRMGIDFHFPEELTSYQSGKSKKLSNKPLAPSVDQALAGLGKACRSRDMKVPYSVDSPVNSYDAQMRLGNSTAGVTEHYHTTKEADQLRFALLSGGQTMRDLPEDQWHDSFKKRAFRRVQDGTPTEKRGGAPSGIKRLHGNLNSLTITGAATREFIHPHDHRALTIRECARIQSFPDAYRFHGKAQSVIQQIGNAVPPLAAQVFAKHLQMLDGKFGSGLQTASTDSTARLLGFALTEACGMSPALQKTHSLLNGLFQKDLF